MTPEEWRNVETIFHDALELTPAQRVTYLETCAPNIKEEVESLIRSHEESDTFLAEPCAAAQGVTAGKDADLVGKSFGPYRVLSLLGHGGMGSVWLAERADGLFRRQVALKLPHSSLIGRILRERFQREREILAGLSHPNIARLFDAGVTEDGQPYLALEHVVGTPLTQYCDERQLGIRERLQLFLQVLDAVQYAHAHLVVHRDLKPSNILVTEEGQVRLLDFGVAKLLSEGEARETELTLLGGRALTPEYAAPEQVAGSPVTTATDVYALGVLLYRLLTGRGPYRLKHESPLALEEAILTTDAVAPSRSATADPMATAPVMSPGKLAKALRGDLDTIVLKALKKLPGERYATASAFAEDIGRFLRGDVVLAQRDSVGYRTAKFVRRHRLALTVAAFFALLLAGGAVALIWGIIATSREAGIAESQRARAEHRFNDVRSLAHSLLFELHDAIRDLPGSTAARKLIVGRSLQYLDTLAQEASGDVSLQRELASAFERLGDVQGKPSSANVGESSEALVSYGKALALRKAILQTKPQDPQDRLALGRTYRLLGQMLWASGELARSLENARAAFNTIQVLAKQAPSDAAVLSELENDYNLMASVQGGNGASLSLGDANGALRSLREALAIAQKLGAMSPRDRQVQWSLALYEGRTGDACVDVGERTEAVQHYRSSLETLDRVRERGNLQDEHLRAYILSKVGDALVMNGQAGEALRSYQQQLSISSELARADAHNQTAVLDLSAAYANVGHALLRTGHAHEALVVLGKAETAISGPVNHDSANALARMYLGLISVFKGDAQEVMGRTADALQLFRQANQIFRSLSGLEQQDRTSRACVAGSSVKIGRTLAKLRQPEEAVVAYEEAVTIAQQLIAHNDGMQEPLYALADAFSGLGDLSAERAGRTHSADRQAKYWQEARVWYEQSSGAWQRIHNPGAVSPTGFSTDGPPYVTRQLARCDTALAALQDSIP